jgi:phosphatidylinositol alpha-1,6-mannosyltransferase
VIRVLPHILLHVPPLEYHVVGEGTDLAYLEALATQCGVEHIVTFLGPVTHKQLVSEYTEADIFVLPSATEGFGLVFLEAMAHAKPVIARRAGASPEVVDHGTTGCLIENEAELASAIKDLLTNPARAARTG